MLIYLYIESRYFHMYFHGKYCRVHISIVLLPRDLPQNALIAPVPTLFFFLEKKVPVYIHIYDCCGAALKNSRLVCCRAIVKRHRLDSLHLISCAYICSVPVQLCVCTFSRYNFATVCTLFARYRLYVCTFAEYSCVYKCALPERSRR